MFSNTSDKPQGSRRLDQIIWDPRGSNRFIVGGGTHVKMYEWMPEQDKIQLVTVQTDLPYMKALAWSPSSIYSDLIAVGMSSGTVELMRLDSTKASLSHNRNHFDSPQTATLIPRHSRSCQALAFSTVDPNYLAVGLDKVRGECSLSIWDVEHSSGSIGGATLSGAPKPIRAQPALQSRMPGSHRSSDGVPLQVPLQQYAASELVNSVVFVPSSHSLIFAGMSQRYVRLYDLRESGQANVAQAWNTKCVYGLCFDPFDENRLAGFGDDFHIRIWDRRKPIDPVLHFVDAQLSKGGGKARPLTSIAWSPTHKGLLASLARDSMVLRIWDIATNERLVETQLRPGTEDSKSERGRASSTSSSYTDTPAPTTRLLNPPVLAGSRLSASFGDTIASFAFVPPGASKRSAPHVVALKGDGRSLVLKPLISYSQHVWGARGHLAVATDFSLRVLQTAISSHQEISVDHKPTHEDAKNSFLRPARHVNMEKKEARQPRSRPLLPSSLSKSHLKPPRVSARGDSPSSLRGMSLKQSLSPSRESDGTVTPRPRSKTLPSLNLVSEQPRQNGSRQQGAKRGGKAKRAPSLGELLSNTASRVMGSDISLVMANRVKEGYGLDNFEDNARIVHYEPDRGSDLHDVWMWMHDHNVALNGEEPNGNLHVLGVDFTIQGAAGIWKGSQPTFEGRALGSYSSSDIHSKSSLGLRTESPDDSLRGNFDEAIAQLDTRRKSKPISHMVSSAHPDRRRLALSLCGWDLDDDSLYAAISLWESQGLRTKAACWSLFTKNVDRAVDILIRSPDERTRIFSAAVAGYVDHRDDNEKPVQSDQLQRWRQQCNRLIVGTDDPYMRTLLQYMVSYDWLDVLDEQGLPLKDRLGIAFRFLKDDQLSSWLERLSKGKISKGQIDGLLVTGLDAAGIDLLQTYVDFHGDVQTAAILATLASPSLRHDYRIERWVESYHDFLGRWKLYQERCQFDIERGRLIRKAIEDNQLEGYEWVERQVVVRCDRCGRIVSSPSLYPVASGHQQSNERALLNYCPGCRGTLPACSICLMPVGMPSDFLRDAGLRQETQVKDTLDSAMVFCMTCRHGGHASHILDWFHGTGRPEGQPHRVCPVADCDCQCADEKLK